MKNYILSITSLVTIALMFSCTSPQEKYENRLKQFISTYEARAIPLYRDAALASWNANVTGTDEDYAKSEKASFELAKIYTDSVAFAELKEISESGEVRDSLLARQLELLYNSYPLVFQPIRVFHYLKHI